MFYRQLHRIITYVALHSYSSALCEAWVGDAVDVRSDVEALLG